METNLSSQLRRYVDNDRGELDDQSVDEVVKLSMVACERHGISRAMWSKSVTAVAPRWLAIMYAVTQAEINNYKKARAG